VADFKQRDKVEYPELPFVMILPEAEKNLAQSDLDLLDQLKNEGASIKPYLKGRYRAPYTRIDEFREYLAPVVGFVPPTVKRTDAANGALLFLVREGSWVISTNRTSNLPS
jgi:hypothetical protein